VKIKKIAVIGGGIMGRGIAHVSALAGFDTILYDISDEVLSAALSSIKANLNKAVDKSIISLEQSNAAQNLLTTSSAFDDAVGEVQFVIEAIPEKINLKTELFSKLNARCGVETILASNTSSLSVTEIAAVVENPSRVIGMHFFNPVHKMKLVEIIKGLETSASAITATKDVAVQMGKEVVTIKESPGFITSRINAMIGNEAFYMLQEGIATAEEIDKALKLGLNHPMGPFEMVDLVGLDTRLSILRFLHQSLGEKYRPCPLMEQYVKAGRLGRKTGKGVYDYHSEKKRD